MSEAKSGQRSAKLGAGAGPLKAGTLTLARSITNFGRRFASVDRYHTHQELYSNVMSSTPLQSSHHGDIILPEQLLQKDCEISTLKAQVLSLTVDNDELKHHRQELRALNEFYKSQSEKFRQEAEDAKSQVVPLLGETEKARDELRMARTQMDALREAVRRAEAEASRLGYEKMGAQSEAGVLKAEASQAKSEADKYRRKANELEKTLAALRKGSEGVASAMVRPILYFWCTFASTLGIVERVSSTWKAYTIPCSFRV